MYPERWSQPVTVPAGKILVSGRAVGSDGIAVAGLADITADCKRAVCSTREVGAFRCAIARPVTGSICIEHERLGRFRVDLDERKNAFDLGIVKLKPGAVVRVVRPLHVLVPDEATLTLLRGDAPVEEPRSIGAREIIEFAGLAPGPYSLLLSGPEPLQRKIFPVEVGERGEHEVALSLDPYRLEGVVEYREKPLDGAKVVLQADAWEAELATDQSGRFSTQLWAPADYGVMIESPALPELYAVMKAASPQDSDWRIAIPARSILGRVTDAESGRPIPDATVTIEGESHGTRSMRGLAPGQDGSYEMPGVGEGSYVVFASAPGYLRSERVSVEVGDADDDRRIDLQLVRAVEVALNVVDHGGAAVAGADVLTEFSVTGDVTDLSRTDERGVARVTVRPRSAKTVFILPPAGPFTIAFASADQAGNGGARAVVPPVEALVQVVARSTEERPLEGIGLQLRYGGVEIPQGVSPVSRARSKPCPVDEFGR